MCLRRPIYPETLHFNKYISKKYLVLLHPHPHFNSMQRKFTAETKMKLEISEKEYVLLPGNCQG